MGSDSLNAAIDRFFRSYFNQLQEPDPDTLLNFLNALYGLNDKLKKQAGRDLFGSANFLALKALRNLFHHHVELVHEIKLIPLDELPPMTTDLMIVCLVPRSLIERAQVEGTERRHQEKVRSAFAAFKWYGNIVNIQPCMFNVAVDVFEAIADLDVDPSSDAYDAFEEAYRLDEQSGRPTRATGDIWCAAGSLKPFLIKRPPGRTNHPLAKRRCGYSAQPLWSRSTDGSGRGAWSPEQIARRLPIDFPDDNTMRISHEAIYHALFVQGRGALRRELTAACERDVC